MQEITVETVQTPSSPSVRVDSDNVMHLMLARDFNIDTPNKEEDGQLREIWEHGKSLSKTGDPQDVLWQIINLRRTLGAPRLGESPLDKIYRWAKLKRQEKMIQDQLREI